MMNKIYKKLDTLLNNKWIGWFLDFGQILPISPIKKNILLNKKEVIENKVYLSSYPFKGYLNLIDTCNLRCKFCEMHYLWRKYPRQFKNSIDLETLEKYYPIFPRMKSLDLYGGATGEPLLNPYFTEIIEFLKNKNPEIYLTINTNGLLLTNPVIKKMVEVNFDDILVSIHSASEETYQYLVGSSYQRLIENIKKFIEIRGNKKKPQIGLNFALNKINAKDILEFPKLGKELGVDYLEIVHYYHVRNLLSEEVSFYFSPREGNEILKKVYREIKKIGIKVHPSKPPFLPENYNKNTDLLAEYNKQELKKAYCYVPFRSIKFAGCGEWVNSRYVCSCHRIFPLRMNYKDYNFENFHQEIWNHPAFLYLRSTVNHPPYNPICRFCRNKITPIIRCINNALYRELRDRAVEEFLAEVRKKYQIPKIKGLELLKDNPYK